MYILLYIHFSEQEKENKATKEKTKKKEGSKSPEKKTQAVKEKRKEKKPNKVTSDIPWPPGKWRLGRPHSRAKYIFMRYATKGMYGE